MKKIFLIKIFTILVILAIIIVLILFSKKIDRIKFEKSISKAINENNDMTVIDVTDISIGSNESHQHIYEIKYNSRAALERVQNLW